MAVLIPTYDKVTDEFRGDIAAGAWCRQIERWFARKFPMGQIVTSWAVTPHDQEMMIYIKYKHHYNEPAHKTLSLPMVRDQHDAEWAHITTVLTLTQ